MSRLFLVLALLASVSATLAAEDPGTPKSPPSTYEWPTLNPEPTQQMPGLMQRWLEYDQKFNDSMTSLDLFLSRVEAFGISFETLPGFIEHLATSLSDSEKARLEERETARQANQAALDRAALAERAATWWRRGTVAAAAFGVAGWVAFGAALLIN